MKTQPTDGILALRRRLSGEIARAVGPGAQQGISESYGISQPRMSELERGMVNRCSIEWLIRRIHRMGGWVEITVTLGDVRRAWLRERFARARNGGGGRSTSLTQRVALIPKLE